MNPIADGLDEVRQTPLSDVRRNLRIPWYRCPIERETLRDLAEPSDLRGLAQSLGHLGLWVATGLSAYLLFASQVWWGFLLALFIGFLVVAGFTKFRQTGRASLVVRNLVDRMDGERVQYLGPGMRSGPADQLKTPELLEQAAQAAQPGGAPAEQAADS